MTVTSKLALAVATWFGAGYFPKGPGTAGSAAAIAIAWTLHHFLGWQQVEFGVMAAALYLPGVWAASVVARQRGIEDPQIVVVDEVIGQWITLVGATAIHGTSLLIGLVLFRVFDVWKPFPARRLERLREGWGIVADDAMAGVYGAAALYALGRWNVY